MSSSRLLGTARIAQLGLHFHKRSTDTSGKCNIAAPGTGVFVAVYELSSTDKAVLDNIEGVGHGYVDHVIQIPDFGECRTYISADSHVDESIQPFDWYRELVVLGCSYLEFPETYIASIAAIDSISDPDSARREQNEDLIERIRRSL